MELEFTLGAAALNLVYALGAILALFLVLRWLDRRMRAGKWNVGVALTEDRLAAAIYLGLRFLGACLLMGLVLGCTPASAAGITDRYDGAIQEAVDDWWPDLPVWKLWKAQLWQESLLNPAAVSPAGARGLAQFMPGTWRDAVRALGLSPVVSPHDEIAIAAGAWYMAKQRKAWTAKRTALERHALGLASYNAGLGNILKAQASCGGARLWVDVLRCLPAVTGARNARETTSYVERIMSRWWPMLEAAP